MIEAIEKSIPLHCASRCACVVCCVHASVFACMMCECVCISMCGYSGVFGWCGVPVHKRMTSVTGRVLILVMMDLNVTSLGITSVAMIITILYPKARTCKRMRMSGKD